MKKTRQDNSKSKRIIGILLVISMIIGNFSNSGIAILAEENSKESNSAIIDSVEKSIPEDGTKEYKVWKEQLVNKENENSIQLFSTGYNGEKITNDYIEFNAKNKGYWVGTTGGNPDNKSDDNKRMIYGDGGTSYTTVRIDGNDYEFLPNKTEKNENEIISTDIYDGVKVTRHIKLCDNQYTERADVVGFYYDAVNTTEVKHNVGIRIMFDTMLGDNDSAPFRLPNVGDVTTETDLKGEDIPEFWQAFDKLSDPSVIAQGTLKADDASAPNRVRFTNWSVASSNPWDYTRTIGSNNGDSAVCLYWEKELNNNENLECKTYYGLSALQQDMRPPLSLSLSGATKIEVKKDKTGNDIYAPNPFTVTAYIQNVGNGDAENVKAVLNLPKGLEIVGDNKEKKLGKIVVGTKQHQISWKVKILQDSKDRELKYGVTLSADNASNKTLERKIKIPKLKGNMVKVQVNRTMQDTYSTVKLKLINTGTEDMALNQMDLRYYYATSNEKQVLNTSVGQIDFRGWYMDQNTLKIKSEDSGIDDIRANKVLKIEFDNKEVLKANEEIVINFNMYKKDNGTIKYSDYYSGTASAATNSNKNEYVDWETINVLNKNTGALMFGTIPVKGSMFSGDIFENSNLSIRSGREIILDNVELKVEEGKCRIEGKLKTDNIIKDIAIEGNIYKAHGNRYIITPDEKTTAGMNILYMGFVNKLAAGLEGKENLTGKDTLEIALKDECKNEIYHFINEVNSETMSNVKSNGKDIGENEIAQSYMRWYFDYSCGSDPNMTAEYVQGNINNTISEIKNTMTAYEQEKENNTSEENIAENVLKKTGIKTLGYESRTISGSPNIVIPYGIESVPESLFTQETRDYNNVIVERGTTICLAKKPYQKTFVFWQTVKASDKVDSVYRGEKGIMETNIAVLEFTRIVDQKFHKTDTGSAATKNFTVEMLANNYVVSKVKNNKMKIKELFKVLRPYEIKDIVTGFTVSDGSKDRSGKKTANLFVRRIGVNSVMLGGNSIKNVVRAANKYTKVGKILDAIMDAKEIIKLNGKVIGKDIYNGTELGNYNEKEITKRTYAVRLKRDESLRDASNYSRRDEGRGDYIEMYSEINCADDDKYDDNYKKNRKGKIVLFLNFSIYDSDDRKLLSNQTMSYEFDLISPQVKSN